MLEYTWPQLQSLITPRLDEFYCSFIYIALKFNVQRRSARLGFNSHLPIRRNTLPWEDWAVSILRETVDAN